ncbi:reverse transcriptase domain-containing protein [Tanacetum coccineum]
MIRSWPNDRKRKSVERDESWMKAPIVFPLLSMEDASDEPLIIEAIMEGYLVRRVYVDQGASVEVMFEHYFENLSPAIRSRLRGTQMDLVGFAGGVVKPLGKIELEVVFSDRVPHPKGDRDLGHPISHHFRVPEVRKEKNGQTRGQSEYQPRERSPRKSGFDRTDIGQPSIPESAGNNRGKPIRTIEILYMDIKPGAREERRWKLEDVHRLQKYQLGMPKNYYPMPNIDGKIESVAGFRYKCFLDAYKRYHQVQMAQGDEEKTAFYTDQGAYCYTKMPFGLKNVGTTYQRLVDTAFQSQIGRNLEAYVDDMVIKSNDEKVLIEDIAETFDNLRRINMKLNPKKCSFGVEEGKLLGYMVTSEGIRDNPTRTKAIADMQSPRTLKEMQSLSGKLAALKRFLSRDEKGHSRAAVANHPSEGGNVIRICGSDNGGRGDEGKLTKYLVELGAYNIAYEPRNAMKGQLPNKDDVERWTLFTDGASNSKGSRAGLVLISHSGVEFMYALRLNFVSTNNEAEYEALLVGLRMARKIKVQNIDVKVDSKLVESQINGSYVASSTSMIKYLATTKECIAEFKTFAIQNIPRNLNQKADILSKLATHAFDTSQRKPTTSSGRSTWDLAECISERGTCSSTEMPQNINDFNHGPMDILPMVNGHPWPSASSIRKVEENGLVERANKILMERIKASLTYASKAVIPAKIGMPTHRTMMIREDKNEDELRLNMDLLQERREAAAIREAKYKTNMEQYYN